MEYTSAGKDSQRTTNFEHQVFLSFRGDDTGSFAAHLFNALKNKGFRAFIDDDGLEYTKDIQRGLYEAIGRSETSVVILSRGYADSRWCLDELVKIMELASLKVHSVLPVFFDVEPTEVRHQTGFYESSFRMQEKRFASEMDMVEKWRSAFKQVAALRGLSLSADRDESQLVNNIIKQLSRIVNTSKLYVPPYLVGRDWHLGKINTWLQDGSTDVEVGLIYGLGGIGKSTIAKIAYNSNATTFDGCSFLADFTRKTTQPDGLTCLMDQLILDVTGKEGNKIYNIDKGMNLVRAILCCRRVLVVLDDVDELKYLPDAFDDPNFYGKGSKIIITSRNEALGKVSLFKWKLRVIGLDFRESKELLKLHACINRCDLSQHEEELLDGFLQHCEGNPLALHVLGPLLRNETEEMWESLLKELKSYPDKIFDVFRLSFDCINDKYTRELFLYIACFFVGRNKAYALKILEGCKLRPTSGLQDLMNRCLITIDQHGTLIMHQSIEEMGKEIARREVIDEPGRRSKIWSSEDSNYVLQNDTGTSFIRGLRLDLPEKIHAISQHHNSENYPKLIRFAFNILNPWRNVTTMSLTSIKTSSFAAMSNLNILLLNNVQLDGSYEVFPKKLKWLLWRRCPLHSIPSNFNLDELVVLDMQESSLLRAWGASKYMGALKILDLSYSRFLVRIPDLSSALLLECLFLKGCLRLEEVCKSVGDLKYLMHLNVEGCESLVRLDTSIGDLRKLIILNLKGCKSLMSFPIPESVVELNLDGCEKIFMVPIQTESLVPSSSFGIHLPFLQRLHLANCGISRDDILERLSSATSLQYLDLSENPIHVLNNDMRSFPLLEKLDLSNCTKLHSVLQLPSYTSVAARSCSSLKRVSYVYKPNPSYQDYRLQAPHCAELVEIDYGLNKTHVKWTSDMDGRQAAILGFPDLHTFDFKSKVMHVGGFVVYGRGVYQGGIYQVYLPGDHLTKWFTTTATTTDLHFIVPSSPVPIQALQLGFVVSADERFISKYRVAIKNFSRMWEWSVDSLFWEWRFFSSGEEIVTWLSYWCVMEHREIKSGDVLKICLAEKGIYSSLKWGVNIKYAEKQQAGDSKSEQHFNGPCGKATQNNDDPCSSQGKIKNWSTKTRTSSSLPDLSVFQDRRPHGKRTYNVQNLVYL